MATRTIASPAVWSVGNNVFVALQGDGANCPPDKTGKGLVALKIRVDPAPAIETAWCATVAGNRGSPIVTTTNGGANPIVFIVGAEGDDRLYAFRGDTGELIASPPEHLRGFHRYQTLIAAGDRLYVASGGQVYACTRKCADRMSALGVKRQHLLGVSISACGPQPDLATLQHVTYLIGKPRAWISYFNPITIESGPTSGSTRVFENPTSRIQA